MDSCEMKTSNDDYKHPSPRKRTGRPRKTESEKKVTISLRNIETNKRRIFIGSKGKRWYDLKTSLGLSDQRVIDHLLDIHEKSCTRCDIKPKAVIVSPNGTHQELPAGMHVTGLATQFNTEPNASGETADNAVEDWQYKFVIFPESWNEGELLSRRLTFESTPSPSLQTVGMTLPTAICPASVTPPPRGLSPLPLTITNFLEMYLSARMMDEQCIEIDCGGRDSKSHNITIILKNWMRSFFGIVTKFEDLKSKAGKVVTCFKTLENRYVQNMNKDTFQRLSDFLLSYWSDFQEEDYSVLQWDSGDDMDSQRSESNPGSPLEIKQEPMDDESDYELPVTFEAST